MTSLHHAVFFCACIVLLHGEDRATVGGQWSMYVWMWLAVPPLSVASALRTCVAPTTAVWDCSVFRPLTLLASSLFAAGALSVLKAQGTDALAGILLAYPIVVAVANRAAGMATVGRLPREMRERCAAAAWALAPPLIMALTIAYFTRQLTPRNVIVASVAAIVSRWHRPLLNLRPRTAPRYAVDAVFMALIALLLLDADLHDHGLHYNFYLGPVAAVLGGKTLLVDVACQYGPGPIHALAAFMKLNLIAPTRAGMSLALSAMLVVQYALLYAVMRSLLRSQVFAMVAIVLMVLVNVFGGGVFLTEFPSGGPLRFGPSFALIAVIAWRSRRASSTHTARIVELLVLAATALWSAEALFYAVMAWLAALCCEHALPGDGFRPAVTRIGRRIVGGIMATAAAWMVAAVAIRLHSGAWPSLAAYAGYLRLYASGFGGLLIDPWSTWVIMPAMYLVSVMAVVWSTLSRPETSDRAELPIVAGMTVLGIAQFTYFLGRANLNNLHPISIPSIAVAAYWLVRMGRVNTTAFIPRPLRASCIACGYAALAVTVAAMLPRFIEKVPSSALASLCRPLTGGWIRLARSFRVAQTPAPTDGYAAEAVALVRKHTPDRSRIAIFLGPYYTIEVLLLTGKAQVFPVAMFDQDALLRDVRDAAVSFRHGLAPGDIIFLGTGRYLERYGIGSEGVKLERALVERLEAEFVFRTIEIAPNGQMAAVRLGAPRGP